MLGRFCCAWTGEEFTRADNAVINMPAATAVTAAVALNLVVHLSAEKIGIVLIVTCLSHTSQPSVCLHAVIINALFAAELAPFRERLMGETPIATKRP